MNLFRGACHAFCCIATSAVTCLPVHADTDWNQWRGPNRDGAAGTRPWPNQLQGKWNQVWAHELAPSYSGPVVQDGFVFTTETIDKKIERVTAYDLVTGEKAWTREWPGSLAVPFFAAANGDWIRSTPVSVPGSLIVLGMRDVLVRFDTKTGEEKWRIDFPLTYKTPLQPFGATCSPMIHDDAVFVQLGGGLTKVDLETGDVTWQALAGGGDMSSTGAFSSPTIATICGVEQLLVQTREKLCGVSPDTGKVLWEEPIASFRGMNILTPLAIGDAVFTAAHSGSSQMFDITHDSDTWKVNERWRQKTQGYMSSPVVIGEHLYMHMKNERAVCLSIADGEIRWTSPPVGKYWSMAHNDNKILALADDGVLRLIDPNPERFTVIDEIKVADDSWAHIAVQGDLVIVRALDRLAAYRWGG
ncbi:PQQ-binding-like beta-propeller repeat protein [Aporhodopirellula aestuarii]|uniref:PQQ-like beta-propeller repeat protein n=1 Tax=Aporhodopirellula aestuarii TaxID=2950107 RepID=A0ABT0UCD9_9BACT|nr:PQQ-binding-like beta-propeller repeat protein [Aporhodopirellula aestuarii]MCM2374394.1 PQQ-like beta-propeller repeat protein [Aporhodopirellula aestuarii]